MSSAWPSRAELGEQHLISGRMKPLSGPRGALFQGLLVWCCAKEPRSSRTPASPQDAAVCAVLPGAASPLLVKASGLCLSPFAAVPWAMVFCQRVVPPPCWHPAQAGEQHSWRGAAFASHASPLPLLCAWSHVLYSSPGRVSFNVNTESCPTNCCMGTHPTLLGEMCNVGARNPS